MLLRYAIIVYNEYVDLKGDIILINVLTTLVNIHVLQ